LSRDQIIYFDDEQGWVYQHPDQALIHSIYNAIEANSAEDIEYIARPMKKLGPFNSISFE